ncbi:MAG: YciI family protein [Propylenella sp.]
MPDDLIAAGDVLNASKGMLQKQLYVILTEPTAGIAPIMANVKEHLDYQIDLEKRGIMFAAGPFWTDDGKHWAGEGMVIVRAPSHEEAVRIAEADPMHRAGARRFRVRPWLINEGSLTVKIGYSDQKVEIL